MAMKPPRAAKWRCELVVLTTVNLCHGLGYPFIRECAVYYSLQGESQQQLCGKSLIMSCVCT